jgi:hypothetical protein
VAGGREEDEDVVQVVLLGELQRDVKVGEDGLVNLGRGAGAVALVLNRLRRVGFNIVREGVGRRR